MNINEVPQEPMGYKGKDKVKKLVYAIDKDGHYTGVGSAGWDAENEATKQAWEAIDDELKETEQQVRNGTVSPIAYFMHKKLMDVGLLAKYAGKWQWQIKRHLKPEVFKKLDSKTLEKYAEIFGVSKEQLIGFGK